MDICYHNSFGLTDRVHQDHLAWKEPREQKVLRYSSEIRYCGSLASTVKGKNSNSDCRHLSHLCFQTKTFPYAVNKRFFGYFPVGFI